MLSDKAAVVVGEVVASSDACVGRPLGTLSAAHDAIGQRPDSHQGSERGSQTGLWTLSLFLWGMSPTLSRVTPIRRRPAGAAHMRLDRAWHTGFSVTLLALALYGRYGWAPALRTRYFAQVPTRHIVGGSPQVMGTLVSRPRSARPLNRPKLLDRIASAWAAMGLLRLAVVTL
jgi:hypothetical protein